MSTAGPELHAYPPGGLRDRALDLIFPPLCVGCRRVGRWICPHCWHRISWLTPSDCGLCGTVSMTSPCPGCAMRLPPLDGYLAVAEFDDVSREAVHALKYNGRHAISQLLGPLMADVARPLASTIVVPVRLHPRRRRERGYDQTIMLSSKVARALEVRHGERALRRIRYTRQQVTLEHIERHKNVAGAFAASPDLRGQRVLLIDDVMTTGATMSAAAEAVRAAGAEAVYALVFAWAH